MYLIKQLLKIKLASKKSVGKMCKYKEKQELNALTPHSRSRAFTSMKSKGFEQQVSSFCNAVMEQWYLAHDTLQLVTNQNKSLIN